MDYDQKYNEAIQRAKALLDGEASSPGRKKWIEEIFPELRESEDERVRTRLLEYFQGFLAGFEDCYKEGGCVKWEGLDVKSILNWLEKQKEDNAEWNKKPCLTCQEYDKGHKQGYIEGCTAGYNKAMKEVEQKEQKPAEINVKALLAADRLASAEMTGRLKERSEILENPKKYGLQKPAEPTGKLSREEYLYQLLIDQLITYSDYEYLTGKKPADWCEQAEKWMKEE